ncbi:MULTISPECIES: SCP2 sterol-binding domain-containing protein [Actinoplanes]|uniref:SCP2 sterol-binding domain-containing protein n=1 Tax=Actinoplanes TaxID=1865 RepID=UPI0005F2E359|nr:MULTISPECIES: SCP2 sterol-binding domain-containing protein [Actinoplanes]GLY00469.1 hypothetical protein Acsp01_08480 [Actinoplanes sp. NBRC 101535]
MTIEADPVDDPQTFARQVRAASERDLGQLMGGESRGAILDGIFRRMPEVFRPDRAGDLRAVVHWHVTDGAGGADVYEVVIEDGRCTTAPGTSREPRLTLRLDAVNFVRMVTGAAAAWTLFLRGRLKARGDLGLTRTFPTLFDTPRA